MSKDIDKDKARCTLSNKELIEKSNEWVSKLAKSGGKDWTLRVPVNFNHDPDMLFIELGKRLESLSTENVQLREALREMVATQFNSDMSHFNAMQKAKQLLTDKE